MIQPPIDLRNPYKAALLAWLIPGLGHYYQGRTRKALLYATCIFGLYFLGFAMGQGKIVYWRWVNPLNNPEKFCIYYIGQFFMGIATLPALIQATLKEYGMGPTLWGFLAEPSQNVINGLHASLGKTVEIGTIYTTVAGLLNILAIYDALEGPAYHEIDEAETAPAGPLTVPNPAGGGRNLNAEGSA